MTSTSRKWAGAIAAGLALLVFALWLNSRHPQLGPAPTRAAAEVANAPGTTRADALSVPPTITASPQFVAAPRPVADVSQVNITQPSVLAFAKREPAAVNSTSAAVLQAPVAIDEVAGTRRMYAAHAPLRAPAVADPDSVQNRQVLQTMVTKALGRAAEAEPVATK